MVGEVHSKWEVNEKKMGRMREKPQQTTSETSDFLRQVKPLLFPPPVL
jgi:hypothetical protein